MGTIYLRRFDEMSGTPYIAYWYKVPVFADLNIDYSSPASPMPLPEEDDEENIIIKMEGNSSNVTVSWLIKEESNNMGAANSSAGFSWGANIQKVWEQVSYLQTKFVPVSIEDSFELCIDADDDISALFDEDATFDFKKKGTITKLNFRISSSEPATINASLTFMVGNVVTAYQLDTPSKPKDFTLGSGASGRLDVSFTAPTTPNGSVKYTIFYKKVGTSTWLENGELTYTSGGYQITSLDAGATYDVYVRAKNSNGYGERTGTKYQLLQS